MRYRVSVYIIHCLFDLQICLGEACLSEYDSFDSNDIPGRPKDKYVLSSRSNLADAQKEKIDKLLQDVQSRTLAFVAIMRKSNVQPPYPSLVNFLSSFSVHYNRL